MKIIGRVLLALIMLIVVATIFRSSLYRKMITYQSVGIRSAYVATDERLIDHINLMDDLPYDPSVGQIIRTSLAITAGQLNYTAQKNDNDPNKLITSKTAHCVGYAHFFATTCNYLLEKYNLDDQWTAKPQVGQLYFLGVNIHQYFSSPFFKDHDYVTIENGVSREVLAVDPTVNDYLGVGYVRVIEN